MAISKSYRKSRNRKFRGRKTRRHKRSLRKYHRRGGGVARITKDNFETGLEIGKFYIFYDSNDRALFCGKLLIARRSGVTLNNFTDFIENITESPSIEVGLSIDSRSEYPVSYAIENNGSCNSSSSALPSAPASSNNNPFMPPPPL